MSDELYDLHIQCSSEIGKIIVLEASRKKVSKRQIVETAILNSYMKLDHKVLILRKEKAELVKELIKKSEEEKKLMDEISRTLAPEAIKRLEYDIEKQLEMM